MSSKAARTGGRDGGHVARRGPEGVPLAAMQLENRRNGRSALASLDNALLVVAVIVVAAVALSVLGWVIGVVTGLVWFVVKVAVVGLIIGLIARAVVRR